ncbi:DUF262 domain-containing protein [Dethiosulfatarculus sandiegensis]|uniref:GmrSD restriction endonucleases N-terminal domain-containing protein n=1 Tax=Dethiosulfatarculus sandiegensis TaxID=1429043 RepID=A0A0D2JT63_9BACT|nr:DUF262 domain-containing protein [Dethiosulfatarculus sandiegensis]KIX12680.1 hypothetical protein X474_17850 [Dethiosulfatarculus sandiegensis]
MSLQDQIDQMRKEIRTDGYGMSIGEWISLYENKEIDIHPEFQRFFRWSLSQKSDLIESILLGIPIPPIFVSQRKDGVWDVVDGLQRLSTIYQFVGVLKDESTNNINPLVLQKTKYLSDLEGKKWNDLDDTRGSLTAEQRLIIKRSKINVSIILRESDDIAKYELFQRLNTGGSALTPQEVRNCILVMVKPEFYKWLRELADNENFQESISLSDKNIIEQYDLELALRFIIFSNLKIEEYDRSRDVGEYLTSKMIELAEGEVFDYDFTLKQFEATFDLLARSTASNSFRRYTDNKFKGGFLLSPFEVVAYGLGYNYPDLPSEEHVVKNVKQLYTNKTYNKWSGSGARANTRVPNLMALGRKLFSK